VQTCCELIAGRLGLAPGVSRPHSAAHARQSGWRDLGARVPTGAWLAKQSECRVALLAASAACGAGRGVPTAFRSAAATSLLLASCVSTINVCQQMHASQRHRPLVVVAGCHASALCVDCGPPQKCTRAPALSSVAGVGASAATGGLDSMPTGFSCAYKAPDSLLCPCFTAAAAGQPPSLLPRAYSWPCGASSAPWRTPGCSTCTEQWDGVACWLM